MNDYSKYSYSQLVEMAQLNNFGARTEIDYRQKIAKDIPKCRLFECNLPASNGTEDYCQPHYLNLLSWTKHE